MKIGRILSVMCTAGVWLLSTSALAAINTNELERLGNQYQQTPETESKTTLQAELSDILSQTDELTVDNRAAIGCAQTLLGDTSTGKPALHQSAEKGSGYGAYCLGMVTINDGDKPMGLKWLHTAAERDYPLAFATLGEMYRREGKRDEAIEWYQQAYEQKQTLPNLSKGMIASNIGLLYSLQKNYPQAEKWFKQGVDDGYASSAFKLAEMYDTQLKQWDKAKLWYQKGHEMGDASSAYNLAIVYEEQKQYADAERWYKKAVERKVFDATFNLAYLYKKYLKEYDKAAEWYQKAVAMGDKDAAFNLGVMYKELKQYDKAVVWYKKADAMGHSDGAYNLGYLYDAILEEYDKAAVWYKKAIELGHSGALFNLPYMYEIYVKDYPKAKVWYQKVADKGDKRGYWGIANVLVKQGKRTEGAGYYYYAVKQGNKLSAVMDYIDKNIHLTDAELKAGYEWQKQQFDDPYTGEMGR